MLDKLVYLFYVLLFVILFWGAKFFGRKKWNDEFMSIPQTKALQGFSAICILLHHVGQKTCAHWLNPKYIVHGLDVFVPIGYYFVGIFLFCSGYGLLKSYRAKQDYLKGFFASFIKLGGVFSVRSTSAILLALNKLYKRFFGFEFGNLSTAEIAKVKFL